MRKALLVLCTAAAIAFQAAAQTTYSQPVKVTNAANAPVPVNGSVTVANPANQPVPVTGAVSATVTGNVSAAVTGGVSVVNTPTVVVGNTPNVNVANIPTVAVGNTPLTVSGTVNVGNTVPVSGTVTIGNSEVPVTGTVNAVISNTFWSSRVPVSIKDADPSLVLQVRDAGTPYQDSHVFNLNGTYGYFQWSPGANRLEMEMVSADCVVPNGGSLKLILTPDSSVAQYVYIALTQRAANVTLSNFDDLIASQPIKLYVPANGTITFAGSSSSAVAGQKCYVTVSGRTFSN